ncbi:hypothetical protein L3Y34_002284 [Caenorhabditis briggsae]|uniref:Uncharacterized protein n=1 Tax=Caenorhabditis briggsae TaxID=6238 RepID=A0AAE9DEZ8_CAEBR|nr:hypothetical protein L3Y34_002284 [Caenorhabditis briggsae]
MRLFSTVSSISNVNSCVSDLLSIAPSDKDFNVINWINEKPLLFEMSSKVSLSYTEQEEQRDHNIQLVRENKGKKAQLYRCEYPEKDNSICSFVGVHAAINEHFFQHTGAFCIQCVMCSRFFGGKLEFHHHRKVRCNATTSMSRSIHKPFFQVENDAELRSIYIRPATEEEKKEARGTDGFCNWSSRVERLNFNNNAWDGYHPLNESEGKKRERIAAHHEDIRKRHGREPSPCRDSGSSSRKRHRYKTDDYRKRRRSRSSSGSLRSYSRHRGSRREESSRGSQKVPEATSEFPMIPPKKKKTEMNIPLVLATEMPQQRIEIAIPPLAKSEEPIFHGPSQSPEPEGLIQESQSGPGTSNTSSSTLQEANQVLVTLLGTPTASKVPGSFSSSVSAPLSHFEVLSAMAQPEEDSGLDTVTKDSAATVTEDLASTVTGS